MSRLAIALVVLVLVAVLIGAAGMFFALSKPADDIADDVADGDWSAIPKGLGEASGTALVNGASKLSPPFGLRSSRGEEA